MQPRCMQQVLRLNALVRSGHDGYDDHIPGVRPKDPDGGDGDMDKMSHRELIAAHHHDHNKYAEDYPHTNLDGEHFHH